jgi:nucleoside-diphosphate-sugar epimerase
VSHNFLFSDVYESLRTDVTAGRLGKIDSVSIIWRKELPFIRKGPQDHWSIRKPGNAILEVGVHSLAHLLDLVGEPAPDDMYVNASCPVSLTNGAVAYRHWHVHAEHSKIVTDLTFSLSPGYNQHTIQVRGSLGTATCDFEASTYTLRRGSRYSVDVDRLVVTTAEATKIMRQALRNFVNYAFSKANLITAGNAYELSIGRGLQAYYSALRGHAPLDERLTGQIGSRTVQLAARIGDAVPQKKIICSPPRVAVPRSVNILVTGGTGFIGRELVKKLVSQGRCVRIITRSPCELSFGSNDNLEIMQGDILNEADQERALKGIDVVYHLARGNGSTYEDYVKSDVEPTRSFAEKAASSGVRRFIYASSIVVFNWADSDGIIRDDTPIDRAVHRRSAYARSKAEAERILLQMWNDRGLPVVIFRPGIVIGSGGDPCHWGVGMWLSPGVCQVWGSGKNPLPFVLVEDVAAAMALAMDNEQAIGKTFNIVDDPMMSARDYLEEFERASGSELQK